jgi:hypothetical protein
MPEPETKSLDGYGRPHVSRALHRANRELDANDDGVACEA